MTTKRYLILLTSLAALWGGSFIYMRIAAPVVGPYLVADGRVWVAAISLLLYSTLIGKKPLRNLPWKKLLLLGAVNAAIPFALIAYSEIYIDASMAAILNAMTPLCISMISVIFFNVTYQLKQYVGFVLGIFGVAVLVGWGHVPMTMQNMLAIAASLLAAVSYGFGATYAARQFKGLSPLAMSIGQQIGAGIVLLPLALGTVSKQLLQTDVLLSILALGVLSTAVAYLVYFELMKHVGASKTLVATYLAPAFGILWGYLFLHEAVNATSVMGLAIILFSIYLTR